MRRGKVFYHDFVQYATRRFRHLVELVNAAYAPITQNECTAANEMKLNKWIPRQDGGGSTVPLKHKLFRVGITRNVGRQTNGRGPLSGSVNASRCKFVHILFFFFFERV